MRMSRVTAARARIVARHALAWVVALTFITLAAGCRSQGGFLHHVPIIPQYHFFVSANLNPEADLTVVISLWYGFALQTAMNSGGVPIPDLIIVDPDSSGPLPSFEVNLEGDENTVIGLGEVDFHYEYPQAGTYSIKARLDANGTTRYAETSVTVGSSPPTTQTGTGQTPPPQGYGDTSGVREVIITLNYMLGGTRGELPPVPPDLEELERQFVELPTIQALLARGYVLLQNWGEVYSGLFRLPPGVTYEQAAQELPQEFPDILQVTPEFP